MIQFNVHRLSDDSVIYDQISRHRKKRISGLKDYEKQFTKLKRVKKHRVDWEKMGEKSKLPKQWLLKQKRQKRSSRQIPKRNQSKKQKIKVLEITEEKLVSIDFNHNPASSIVDASLTNVIGKNMGKISAWYDNEWGFSNRMCDIAAYLHKIS